MKYLRQFGIILAVAFAGELLKYWLPFPVPGSIYGLALMLGMLCAGIIPLEKVKETGLYLVEIMPLLFIPPTVGLMASFDQLREILVPAIFVIALSTTAVMVVSGRLTQYLIRRERGRRDG